MNPLEQLKKRKLQANNYRERVIENMPLIFYRSTFYSIVAVLEARDAYTAHHSERVSVMAGRFCSVLHLPPFQAEMIEMTAAVHDIGKAGISDATLKKPGRLDDAEWREIKNHPTIGADIIRKAGQVSVMPEPISRAYGVAYGGEGRLDHVADGIAAHHERWNGTGYPKGLLGENIPYVSRVIALCDSVDAMLSRRVYREALSEEQCRAELERGKGVMYDPKLTDTFLTNWKMIVGDMYSQSNLLQMAE